MKTKTLYNEQYVECEYDVHFNDVLDLIDTCTENEKRQILNQLKANDILIINTLEDEEKMKVLKVAFEKYNVSQLMEKLSINYIDM
jgi:uncharacterized Zn finger protein